MIVLLFLSGCATLQTFHPKIQTQTAAYWLEQAVNTEIVEARQSVDKVWITFRVFTKDSDSGQLFYASGNLADLIPEQEDGLSIVDQPMKFSSPESWQEQSAEAIAVPVWSSSRWDDFITEFAEYITPSEMNHGVVIREGLHELIFFRDEQGLATIAEIKNKPVAVRIDHILSRSDYANQLSKALQAFLAKYSIDDQRFVVAADDRRTDGRVFTYMDAQRQLGLGLTVPSQNKNKGVRSVVTGGVRTADQLILDGQMVGIASRPVSSMFRLYSWAKDTTFHTIKPRRIVQQIVSNGPPPPIADHAEMDLDKFDQKLDQMFGSSPFTGTVDFHIGGDQYFPRQIEAFQNARESIDVRIFIFDNDDYAVKIADILKQRARDGIKVRVLIDGIGRIMGEGSIPEGMPSGFKPPASMVKYLRKDSNIEVRVRPNAWFKADHTKAIIIDGQVAYTGGMNIGREYRYDWHDLMMRVEGSIVDEIQYEFDIAWSHAGHLGDIGYLAQKIKRRNRAVSNSQGIRIRPLYTRADDPQIFEAQMAAIRNSQKYIYAANAYFSDPNIIRELIKARHRGVDVRVILPVNGNHEIMNKNNIVIANRFFENGVKVYFYPGMSHVKAAVYDGWLCTGSANFDKLSFIDNLEFNLAISDPATVQSVMTDLFEADFEKSSLMTAPLKSNIKNLLATVIAGQL